MWLLLLVKSVIMITFFFIFYRKSGISEIKNLLDGIKIPFIEISLILLETCILF